MQLLQDNLKGGKREGIKWLEPLEVDKGLDHRDDVGDSKDNGYDQQEGVRVHAVSLEVQGYAEGQYERAGNQEVLAEIGVGPVPQLLVLDRLPDAHPEHAVGRNLAHYQRYGHGDEHNGRYGLYCQQRYLHGQHLLKCNCFRITYKVAKGKGLSLRGAGGGEAISSKDCRATLAMTARLLPLGVPWRERKGR